MIIEINCNYGEGKSVANLYPISLNNTAAIPAMQRHARILESFSQPLDCLTAHLMLECSEVLAGVKPANLISLVNRKRPCGRNLYQLWQSFTNDMELRFPHLTFMVLQTTMHASLLLCYNRTHLEHHLSHAGIRVLLCKSGYAAEASCDALLEELYQRISQNNTFPHEIGLFIGYPTKDVAAFMGLVKLPFACQRLWKIYGNPEQSLDLAEQFRCCRQNMCDLLMSGEQNALELQDPQHPFFAGLLI